MRTKAIVVVVFVVLLITETVLAQPGLPTPPAQAPLGGLALLAAAGGLYAVKKLKDRSE
tara:strand:+ start:29379 stop:29555 length:177 start_codon:yes stop_codon:yes gene_type:complete